MKYLLNLTLLLLFLFARLSSQERIFPVTNYTTKDYGSNFHPTNRAITQDSRGVIYAANGFKLLEFDGSNWKSYPINKEASILSLAVDSSGTIYAGSQNEFGLFSPDECGELKYRSLSDSLDLKDLDFTNVWKVHPFFGGVIFQAQEKLFFYRNGKIKVVNPETSFHTSFIVHNSLYVRQRGIGLMEWKENDLVRIKGSEIFDTTGIFMMLPLGKNNKIILIGTQEKGFWLFEPGNITTPFRIFNIEDYNLFEKSIITGGVLTGDRSFAISTMLNGVIVLDTAGKTRAIINNRNGLIGNDVKQLISDQGHNLWLALENGISRIEISSPLSTFNERAGIAGNINTIIRYENLLYAGTTTGLFVQDTEKWIDTPFKPAFGITSAVRSLVEAEGSLLAGTDAGLYQITGKNMRIAASENTFTLLYSPKLKLLFTGGSGGLNTYLYDGTFKKIETLSIEGEDIIGIEAEQIRTGKVAEFWLGTRYNGAIRIKINHDLTFISDRFNKSDGLTEGWVMPYIFSSNTVFGTSQGLLGFTNENTMKESLPDSLKNREEFSKGYFSSLTIKGDTTAGVISSLIETKDKVWFCSNNSVGYLDKKVNLAYSGKPFNGIEAGRINVIYPEENGLCWIGTTDGLIRYDEKTGKDYNQDFFTLIRKVTLPDKDSAIFMGTNFNTESGFTRIVTHQNSAQVISFPYSYNSLRIEYSAPYYEYPYKILYSYRLAGSNMKWSQWTRENFREYTNLHEGKYTFSVKARNIYGTESKTGEYSFIILPPWYRSVAAYIGYVISALILFWLFARLYSYRLKRENLRLEGIVTERTMEVVKQKDEILFKNVVLEHQKKEIEDSIRYARRIQSAVIPSENDCSGLLIESFVVFRPLNIVSGDFYWIGKSGSKIIFTAADCTGHGVPGAFMSMLGVAFLNEIVNKDNITHPEMILNHLRDKVIQALQQQGISGEARDGMDIALVSIDKENKKLEFAGAYNPLVMIRNGEIIEKCPDKMPIGIYENMNPFRQQEIDIEKGDVFYMFSDGYEDQFGGPEGKKFKSKKLKQLFLEIHKNPMVRQKEILEKNFDEWKGDLPQVDDVVIAGFAIS